MPPTNATALLAEALEHHRSGRLDESERLYHDVIDLDVTNADAWHLLGLLHFARGAPTAIGLIRRAIALQPASAIYYGNLVAVAKTLRSWMIAEAFARRASAINLSPGFLSDHAESLFELGRFEQAMMAFQAVEAAGGPAVNCRLNVALCWRKLDRPMHAAAAYRQALGSHPSDGAALVGLAETGYPDLMTDVPIGLCRRAVWSATDQDVVFTALTALASSSIRRGDPRRAQALISGALALLPSSSVGWTNLSEVLRMLDAGGDAACAASRALTLSSIDLGALLNRALAFVALERLPDAVRDLRCAISLAPADHRGYANVLDALVAMARFEDVPLLGRRLAALAPGLNSVRHFFGVALLSAGHLSLAWKELEYRYRDPPVVRRRPFALPWWNGHPLPAGTTLLIWGEQGLGDEVIHASMIPDLIARGHSVVLECDHRLTSIYARSFPKIEVIPRTDPPQPRATAPDVVAQMAMGSLGGWLRPDIASFRPSSPYVTPDPVRVEDWRRRLGGLGPGLKVGIAWRSLRRDSFARRFHTRLSDWGPILTVPGTQFVNLQYDDCADELRDARRLYGSEVHSFADLDLFNDLEGALALGATLDLVVATTASAHCLAAAAGVPTWLLLRRGDSCALGTDHCPWLPRTRGYVRETTETWAPAIVRLANDLRELAAGSPIGPVT